MEQKKGQLIIEKSEASRVVSGIVVWSFILFFTGYFTGKQKALDDFSTTAPSYSTPIAKNESKRERLSNKAYDEMYYASLASFNNLPVAQNFVNRLQRNGINTTLINRKGTASGHSGDQRSIEWYQVVTDSFGCQRELNALVNTIKKIVTVNDTQIIRVDNGISRASTQKKNS